MMKESVSLIFTGSWYFPPVSSRNILIYWKQVEYTYVPDKYLEGRKLNINFFNAQFIKKK